MWRTILKILLALALATFLALLTLVDQFGYIDRAQPADVIVLLGSMVYPGGQLSSSLERRALHAAALYRRGLAPVVICSGGVGTNPPAEALVACGRVVELGVPPSAVIYEDQAHNTEQNAAYTARLMRARGWRSAIIATDGFQLYRATVMFERAGVTAYPSPAQVTVGAMEPLDRIVREMREAVGVMWFWVRVLFGSDLTTRERM